MGHFTPNQTHTFPKYRLGEVFIDSEALKWRNTGNE
jgi:hypothetical protein